VAIERKNEKKCEKQENFKFISKLSLNFVPEKETCLILKFEML